MAPRQPLSGILCVGPVTTVRPNFVIVSRRAWEDNPLEDGPTRNVDYLSHKWEEEDIWTSWRYVVAKHGCRDKVRLINASWRMWAKLKYRLQTVSPETIDWLKDSDVTCLYGPLQICSRRPLASDSAPPPCGLSRSSFAVDKKSILKRKSTFKSVSQRSLLAHTLLKNATAIARAKEDNNTQSRTLERSKSVSIFPRTLVVKYVISSSSSTHNNTPTATPASSPQSPQGRCRIHFNKEVRHLYEPTYSEDRRGDKRQLFGNDETLDTCFTIIRKGGNINQCTASDGMRWENKEITLLPTTLNYQGNTPEISEKGFVTTYDYSTDQTGTWIGMLIGIVAGYCLLGWAEGSSGLLRPACLCS